jgi:hypothetical protein
VLLVVRAVRETHPRLMAEMSGLQMAVLLAALTAVAVALAAVFSSLGLAAIMELAAAAAAVRRVLAAKAALLT